MEGLLCTVRFASVLYALKSPRDVAIPRFGYTHHPRSTTIDISFCDTIYVTGEP